MNKTALFLVMAAITAASTAQAEVSVNVNVGVPAPRVMVSSPPSIHFDVAPLFIAPSRLGFYVGVDTPYDIIYSSDFYYLYYGNSWHRSRHHNGPWVEVPYRDMPPGIRKHRIEQIRSYRDREHRVYRQDRDHYHGKQFRPDHEQRQEMKEERRHDKGDRKDDRRHDREERKEDHRDRDRQGRGRD
jgi:hypothetical protein